jgi:predicted regulator of Ras-like GTPase activity (Roadblock/LC7/MglB family)
MTKHYKYEAAGQGNYVFNQEQLNAIEEILVKDLMDLGIHSVFLIDMAGNIIASKETGDMKHDIYSLAALAAGNFGAVSTMAKLVGEDEFSLLFHKGQKENIHFSKVTGDFLMITIFGKEISLGFLRLKVTEATEKLVQVLGS